MRPRCLATFAGRILMLERAETLHREPRSHARPRVAARSRAGWVIAPGPWIAKGLPGAPVLEPISVVNRWQASPRGFPPRRHAGHYARRHAARWDRFCSRCFVGGRRTARRTFNPRPCASAAAATRTPERFTFAIRVKSPATDGERRGVGAVGRRAVRLIFGGNAERARPCHADRRERRRSVHRPAHRPRLPA
jgi:hypothetical protein